MTKRKTPELLTQLTHSPKGNTRVKMGSFYHRIKVKAISKEGAALC